MSTPITISSIVEGPGDTHAVPLLIRRVAGEVYGAYHIRISPSHRVPRSQMKDEPLRKAIRFQGTRVATGGGVLVLADADDDCPVEFAQRIASCAQNVTVEVAIAVREFEAWFLAAVESLRSHRAVRDDAMYDGDPESPRDAKGRLQHLMKEAYRETLHQPSFASLIDLDQARRARSFDHLVRCIGRIIDARAT